ncbi:aspartyl-tRNA synthetase [Platysternon megacephalum]|uniref:Deoxyribonuclease-1-like 1 n=1 Tax=Platysternon megacephalum TaxID=55544 RepID=A0A4D9DKN2_9SAUR|nr:aspartyl-tRNA synthetase [Platysternon megacephalum]
MGLPLRTLLLLLLLCPAGAPFRICAFNLQRFAGPKAAKAAVMDTLVKILSRCDIAVLQEVMDAKGQAVPALISALHRFAGPDSYTALGSPLLGAGNYQERYVFVYRSGRTQLLDSYVYLDENPARPDAFAREPFDIMFLGDFNADCGYVAKKRWGQIRLRREPSFRWLIGDAADTTVRNSTRCAYDRIVVHGERCLGLVVPGSAQPFDFPGTFGLTETEALEVSDHYPVEPRPCLAAAPRGPTMRPLALLLLGLRLAGAGFKICAFNAHGFGAAKSGDARVMGALVQILGRCDIAAVQEVRDAKGDAVQTLLGELNRYDPSHSYAQLGSRRLGRGTYKEQIVFVYRADLVTVTDWCQFGEAGDFARGPFAARFHAPSTGGSPPAPTPSTSSSPSPHFPLLLWDALWAPPPMAAPPWLG